MNHPDTPTPTPVDSNAYTGHVHAPNGPPGGAGGTDYYEDLSELFHLCASHEEPLPGELFTVREEAPSPPDTETFIRETILDDTYEDAFDHVSGAKVDEMQEFLTRWCATCGVQTWRGTRIPIVLSPEHLARFAALSAEHATP